MHICANVLLCGVVPSEGSDQEWAIALNFCTPGVEDRWNSSGIQSKIVEFFRGKTLIFKEFFRGEPGGADIKCNSPMAFFYAKLNCSKTF